MENLDARKACDRLRALNQPYLLGVTRSGGIHKGARQGHGAQAGHYHNSDKASARGLRFHVQGTSWTKTSAINHKKGYTPLAIVVQNAKKLYTEPVVGLLTKSSQVSEAGQ